MERLLSIVVPVFNEEATIAEVLRTVAAEPMGEWRKEIIIVDDGSTDGTAAAIERFMAAHSAAACGIRLVRHGKNRGKGAALRTAFAHARGEAFAIQDADLEYHPSNIALLLEGLSGASVGAVYGTRNVSPERKGYPHYIWGVKLLTWMLNRLYRARLTDAYTGHKVLHRSALENIALESDGFAIEAEITAKLLKQGFHIKEVPISYTPRTFKEGKKIRPRDGIKGLWTIVKCRVTGL